MTTLNAAPAVIRRARLRPLAFLPLLGFLVLGVVPAWSLTREPRAFAAADAAGGPSAEAERKP